MAITLIAIFTFAGCRPETVTNPATGETWMDRNLGASQVATSSTDAAAYGDLYQWGRAADGHQSRTSGTTTTKATTAVPGGGNAWDSLFIIGPEEFGDWLLRRDNTLWQGGSGINNPCPAGFRLPTKEEWEAERLSWATNDAAGAFDSPLKLTAGGYRNRTNGVLSITGELGYYWGQARTNPGMLFFNSIGVAYTAPTVERANGYSVRCIKD